MTFDLTVLPVDRALTFTEAAAEIEQLSGWRLGLGHDPRLDPFLAEIERRYPGIRAPGRGDPPVELTVTRGTVVFGIGWSRVGELAPAICEAAYQTGLAVWDPQRQTVGLPAPYADAPLGPVGLGPHVESANRMIGAVVSTTSGGAFGEETPRALSGQLRSMGARQMSPLGFEITPEIEDEVFADPNRYPPSLQTPQRKAELLALLAAGQAAPDRHQAVASLASWDPDPDVAAALRPLLRSEDVFEVGMAASGLARQGDITDLPGVLQAVHRMSPADGGSAGSMVLPLKAALALAELAGPEIVLGVRAQARAWRTAPSPSRRDREFQADIDALLEDPPEA